MSCTHEHIKSFQFKDGQTIYCCPDCTAYDNHRIGVLAGKPPKAKAVVEPEVVEPEEELEEECSGEESECGVEAAVAG